MIILSLTLAILAIVLVLTAELLNRKRRARFAETRWNAAALARLHDQPDRAEFHEQRAAELARHVWPFKVRPSTTFEVPNGIVTVNQKLTDEEFAEFAKRWREQDTSRLNARPFYPPIGTETSTETGMFWRQLRQRITRLITREGRDQ